MSTDPLPPEPGDTGITGRTPEPAPDLPPEPEPLGVAPVGDNDQILDAELAEPYDRLPAPPRPRLVRRPPPPAPPHPGFWWSILWCLLMLVVTQVVPAFVIIIVLIARMVAPLGPEGGADQETVERVQRESYLPLIVSSQALLFIFSLVVLRLMVGRDWRRQVALRLPAVSHIVLAVVACPALALAASGGYEFAKRLPGFDHILTYLVTGAATLLLVGACWGAVRLMTGHDWVKALARQSVAVQLVVVPLYCLAVITVAALLFSRFDLFLPTIDLLKKSSMEDLVKTVRQDWPPILAVLIIGLAPGLGEELWCRAYLGRGLVGRHGPVMGVVLASFFFGAIHGDPHQGTMAAVMGLALHFSYLMSRSLCIPMLLHFLNNSLDVIADKLPDLPREKLQNLDTNPAGIPWHVLVASVCLLAAVGWALYSSRGRLVRTDGSGEPPWRPPFAGVAYPPPDSGTAVVHSWPGVLPTLAVLLALAGLVCAMYWS